MNRDSYRKAFDQISFSDDFQARTVDLLRSRAQETQTLEKEHTNMKLKWIRRPAAVAVVAAVVCLLAFCASAAVHYMPVVRTYFGGGAGYQQCAISVGESLTQDGWTLTLTDCVGDDYSLYCGFELAAPEGTVLDRPRGIEGYRIGCVPNFVGLNTGGGGTTILIDDEDPTDNVIRFLMRWEYLDISEVDTGKNEHPRSGQPVELHVGKLGHYIDPYAEEKWWEEEYDCEVEWTFQTTLSYPDNTIRLETDLPVTTLGVEAAITQVEVSPIGVYVLIEGDALKGHHSWLGDKGFICVKDQEVTLYTIDGEAIPMNVVLGMSGSWCSGGEYESDEEPRLHLARRSGTLLDLDTLESVSICGEEIPLR